MLSTGFSYGIPNKKAESGVGLNYLRHAKKFVESLTMDGTFVYTDIYLFCSYPTCTISIQSYHVLSFSRAVPPGILRVLDALPVLQLRIIKLQTVA